jgi:hypothetical protein
MVHEVKLTEQECKIISYLEERIGQQVAWEELAQFAKDPSTVKLKTIQKSVSEIKRKYMVGGIPLPFNVNFKFLAPKAQPPAQIEDLIKGAEQVLVQVRRTAGGNIVPANSTKSDAQIDFSIDPLGFKRVKTRSGVYQLNDSEWDMFKYFYNNVGRLITISELRDKLVYPSYGSKLPARWFDAIMRVINHLRRQVNGLDKRLLTVKGTETSYLFQ